jgi:uncharacterized membrane protein
VNSNFEWQFGGWLQGVSPLVAWGILGVVGIGGLLLIVFLYRRTLRKLSPASRNVLTVLRVALLLVLCVLLAGPARVRRPAGDNQKNERNLAVIVDRSASMDAVDNRNETRLQNALRIWQQHTGEAAQSFDVADHYRFASKLEKVDSLDAATRAGPPGEETQLWKALHDAMADSPAAIVTITDGLDTSGTDASQVIGEAQSHGIPLYFVPGINRSRPADLLSIRDVKTPSEVLRVSRFHASVIAEISAPKDRAVPVSLWSGSRELASGTIKARAGWNLLPWSADVRAGEAGTMPLEFRLGDGAAMETAASTTEVVNSTTVNILYYQGALQWGYRFLRGALESDPSFHLTSILNPALGVKLTQASGSSMDDLPDNAADLKRFQIVILAHVLADQLTPAQQQALVDYAKGGGGVLFIAPDSAATDRFAGTPLEEMLPVVFDRYGSDSQQQASTNAFMQRMQSALATTGGGDPGGDGYDNSADNAPTLVPLTVLPAAGTLLKGSQAPLFSNYARVERAKPAAEVLAVHPTERTSDDAPRVLLARQQFGQGFTVAMATDLLWRWKMSLPSSSRAPEVFWQQLMLSLVPAPAEGMRIVKSSSTAAVNRTASLTVTGATGDTQPRIEAVSPTGGEHWLGAVSSPNGWVATFTPDVLGRWQLSATDAKGNVASMSLPVGDTVRTAENSNAPPDIEGMRQIADATGGALIGADPVFQPKPADTPGGDEAKTSEPLWNQSWLLGTLLGLYAIELIARRMFRLL